MPLRLAQLTIRFPFGLPRMVVACRASSVCSSALMIHIFRKCVRVFCHQLLITQRPRLLHRIRNPRKSPKAQSCSRSELFLGEEAEFRPLQTEDAKSGSRLSFLGRMLRSGTAICSPKETRVRYTVQILPQLMCS